MAAPSPSTQTANAIRAINERANIPVPEIDFTVHELENGEIVRTDQRVVKDVSGLSGARSLRCSAGFAFAVWRRDNGDTLTTGPSASDVCPNRRTILVKGRSYQTRYRFPQESFLQRRKVDGRAGIIYPVQVRPLTL